MTLTMSKVKQSLQHPSASSSVSMEKNVVALGGRGGRKPSNGPCLDDKINPLLNNVVLTTLFEHIKGKDLKTYRLVCKQWHHLNLPFFRCQFKVKISDSGERGIESFMKVIGSSDTLGIPFGRYSLAFFDTTKGFGQQFLQTCGNSAKEIIINWDENQTVENVAEILKSTPKLETFKISRYCLRSRDDKVVELFPGLENTKPKFPSLKYFKIRGRGPNEKNICPTFFDEIFQAAQNISTLDLGYGRSSVDLEVLETIEKLGREPMIQNMKFSEVNAKHLEILRRMAAKEKGLKLKNLDWTDHGYDHDFIFFELVELFKNSLISLRYTFNREIDDSKLITFPHMPRMKRLYLSPFKCTDLSCENFPSIFPSLETLYVEFNNVYNRHDYSIPTDGRQMVLWSAYRTSLRSFAQIYMQNLDRLLTNFPTLRFLRCAIAREDLDEVIPKIWAHMTQLEGLSVSTLCPSGNMDSLVTGIPVQEFTKLGDMDEFSNSLPRLGISNREAKIQNALTMMTKNSEFPSIRNLTNLSFLTLHLSGTTDFTAYFGLYFLKNLRHLNVSDCARAFSKSGSEILVKDKNLLNWRFKTTFYGEIIPAEWNYKTVPEYGNDF